MDLLTFFENDGYQVKVVSVPKKRTLQFLKYYIGDIVEIVDIDTHSNIVEIEIPNKIHEKINDTYPKTLRVWVDFNVVTPYI
jgi:hypothetical protein